MAFPVGDLHIDYTCDYNIMPLHDEILRRLRLAESDIVPLKAKAENLKLVIQGRPSVLVLNNSRRELSAIEQLIERRSLGIAKYTEETSGIISAYAKLGPRRMVIGSKATDTPDKKRGELVKLFLDTASRHLPLTYSETLPVSKGCANCGSITLLIKANEMFCVDCHRLCTFELPSEPNPMEEFMTQIAHLGEPERELMLSSFRKYDERCRRLGISVDQRCQLYSEHLGLGVATEATDQSRTLWKAIVRLET